VKIPRQLRDARQRLLWELARNGHARAFRQLYRELSVPILHYVTSRLRSRTDAEDVTSDVFHKLVTSMGKYDPERGSVQAWVMALARNTLIDHVRRARPTEPIVHVADVLADGARDALEQLIEQEDARFAYGILRRYPPEVREMFSLHFAHGLTYRDVATTMGLSEAAVKQRFARTLRELRLELGAHKRAAAPEPRGIVPSPRTHESPHTT